VKAKKDHTGHREREDTQGEKPSPKGHDEITGTFFHDILRGHDVGVFQPGKRRAVSWNGASWQVSETAAACGV